MAGVWDAYTTSVSPDAANNDNPWIEYAGGTYKRPKPASRGILAPLSIANDAVITGVNAGLGLGKAVSDFVSVDNPVSRGLQYVINEGEQNYSDIVKQNRAELNQAMDEGGMEAVKGVGKFIVQNPIQTAAEIIGNVGPFGRAVKLGVKGAQLAGLGAKGATYAGRGVGGALGAAAGGGDAASNAYEMVMNSPNIPDDQKEVLARQAAREASALPALIGGAFGATGLTGNIANRAAGKAAQHGILRTGATEFGQEFGEEGITQLSANLAARQYDPTIDPMKGVVGAATYGGFLGGLGGAGNSLLNRPRVPSNLLRPDTDQTSADDQNQPLLGLNPNVPLQSWINQQTGVSAPLNQNALKSRQADIMAAMNEPSGQFASDENGIERELTMGEVATRGYAPPKQTTAAPATTTEISDEVQKAADVVGISLTNKKGTVVGQRVENLTRALKLLGEESITQDQFNETVDQIKKNRYGAVKKMLDQVEADVAAKADQAAKLAEAKQPRRVKKEADVSAPTIPAESINPSVPTGSPDTAGGLAASGSNAIVGGTNNSTAVLPNANSGEVSLLSGGASQPVTPVVRRKRVVNVAGLQPAQAYTADATVQDNVPPQAAAPGLSTEDQLEIAQATGNASELQAENDEETGLRLEETEQHRQDTVKAILAKRFEKSKDPARDTAIALAYIEALKNAPHNSKGLVKARIGQQFGIGVKSVEKIGDTVALINAAQAMGLDPNSVRGLFEVSNNANTSLTGEQETGVVQKALAAQGVSTGEGENIGFGVENDLYKQGNAKEGIGDTANAKDEAFANTISSLMDQIEALQEVASTTGADLTTQIEGLQTKLVKALTDYETALKGKKNAVQKQSTRKVDVQSETGNGETVGEGDLTPGIKLPLSSAKYQSATEQGNDEEDTDSEKEIDGNLGFQSRTKPIQLVDNDKTSFKAVPTNLAALSKNAGFMRAAKYLNANGLAHTINGIKNWFVTSEPVAWDALFIMIDGEPSIVFSQDTLDGSEALMAVAALHEIGHSADNVFNGGDFSGEPEFNLILKNGVVKAAPKGTVVAEVINHSNEDTALSQLLYYPLIDNKGLTADDARTEIFAQLFAFSSLPKGMQFLRENLPLTAAFMEKTHEQIRASKETTATEAKGAQPRQVQNRAETGTNGARQSRGNTAAAQGILNSPQVQSITESLKATTSTALNKIAFTSDVLRKAISQGLTEAKNLMRLYQQRSALMNKLEVQARKVIDLSDNINPTELPLAHTFLRDSTRLAKWGFQPDWIKTQVAIDPAMRARYAPLSKESKAWIEATLKHGHDMLQKKKNAATDAANLEYDGLIADAQSDKDLARVAKLQAAKASKLKEYGRLFRLNENSPYAPLKRFGDYVVVAMSKEYEQAKKANDTKRMKELEKDETHYFVDFAEDNAAALKMIRDLNESNQYSDVYGREKEAVRDSLYGGTMLALSKLKITLNAELENTHSAAEKAAIKKTQDMVLDMFLTSLAENSARKSELARKGIAGNIDMLRSFATQARSDAHFLAASKHNSETNLVLNKMRQQMKGLKSSQQLEASKTFNEIQKRHGESMEFHQNNWTVGLINRATSIWMLATSPVYYLQNLTQPFMLSLPVMTEHHNYLKAATALSKAYTDVGALFAKEKANGDIDFSKFPADVRKMLEVLSDRGRIQISMDAELGRVQLTSTGVASKAWNKVDNIIRSASEKLEAINRVTTAMAAYRMELAKTGNVNTAIDYADRIIERTHGDYTSINAPRAFNTNLGKVALQFRKFQLIQGTLLVNLVKNSVKGESAEVRAGARKALAFTLGHTAVMAGAVGLPGFALLSFLLSNLGRLWQEPEDEPFDLENTLRDMIGDEDLSNLLLRGAPNLAGIDLSAKLGMGNVFSIVPYSDVELSRKGFNEIAVGLLLGASGAVGTKVFDGLGQIAKGEYYRGIETLMPTGIANGMKAYREQTSGVTRRNGDIILPSDEIDALDTFATAIGLTTTKKALQSQRSERKYQTEQHFNEQGDRIRNEFLQAKKNGESTEETIDKWKRLQDKRVEMGFKRQSIGALFKAAQQQRSREKNVMEGIPYNKSNKRYVEQLTNV